MEGDRSDEVVLLDKDEITDIIAGMKNHKAPGTDGLAGDFSKRRTGRLLQHSKN